MRLLRVANVLAVLAASAAGAPAHAPATASSPVTGHGAVFLNTGGYFGVGAPGRTGSTGGLAGNPIGLGTGALNQRSGLTGGVGGVGATAAPPRGVRR